MAQKKHVRQFEWRVGLCAALIGAVPLTGCISFTFLTGEDDTSDGGLTPDQVADKAALAACFGAEVPQLPASADAGRGFQKEELQTIFFSDSTDTTATDAAFEALVDVFLGLNQADRDKIVKDLGALAEIVAPLAGAASGGVMPSGHSAGSSVFAAPVAMLQSDAPSCPAIKRASPTSLSIDFAVCSGASGAIQIDGPSKVIDAIDALFQGKTPSIGGAINGKLTVDADASWDVSRQQCDTFGACTDKVTRNSMHGTVTADFDVSDSALSIADGDIRGMLAGTIVVSANSLTFSETDSQTDLVLQRFGLDGGVSVEADVDAHMTSASGASGGSSLQVTLNPGKVTVDFQMLTPTYEKEGKLAKLILDGPAGIDVNLDFNQSTTASGTLGQDNRNNRTSATGAASIKDLSVEVTTGNGTAKVTLQADASATLAITDTENHTSDMHGTSESAMGLAAAVRCARADLAIDHVTEGRADASVALHGGAHASNTDQADDTDGGGTSDSRYDSTSSGNANVEGALARIVLAGKQLDAAAGQVHLTFDGTDTEIFPIGGDWSRREESSTAISLADVGYRSFAAMPYLISTDPDINVHEIETCVPGMNRADDDCETMTDATGMLTIHSGDTITIEPDPTDNNKAVVRLNGEVVSGPDGSDAGLPDVPSFVSLAE